MSDTNRAVQAQKMAKESVDPKTYENYDSTG